MATNIATETVFYTTVELIKEQLHYRSYSDGKCLNLSSDSIHRISIQHFTFKRTHGKDEKSRKNEINGCMAIVRKVLNGEQLRNCI